MALLNGRRESSATVAGALILALLVGGLPGLSGVTITKAEGPPAVTLNICHPLPGLNHGSGFSPAPLVTGPSVEAPVPCGAADEPRTPPAIRASAAPDPPPPKSRG